MGKSLKFLMIVGVVGMGATASAQDVVVQGGVEVGVQVPQVVVETPPPPPPPQYGVQAQVGVPVVEVGMAGQPAYPDAHARTALNSINIEGLGPGLLYSVNYERLVINDLAVRLGFSYTSWGASTGSSSASLSWLTFPITASYIGIASGNNALELGGGATLIYASGSGCGLTSCGSGSGIGVWGSVFAGWRVQPPNGGFQFRLGLSVLIGPGLGLSTDVSKADDIGFLPWPYISLGYSF